jgi:tetratricopeptide (TPR) repeat protein
MKKIGKTASIFLTIILCLAIHTKECSSANWVHIYSGKRGEFYIDVDRIEINKNKGEIRIYGKQILSDRSYLIFNYLIKYREKLYNPLTVERFNAKGKLKEIIDHKRFGISARKYVPGSPVQYYVDFVMKKKVGAEERAILKAKPFPLKTKEDFNRVLRVGRSIPYYNAGVDLIKAGKYREALVEFNLAIRTAPTNPLPYEERARIYLKWKKYDKAWDDIKKCQSLNGIVDPELLKELRKASGRDE